MFLKDLSRTEPVSLAYQPTSFKSGMTVTAKHMRRSKAHAQRYFAAKRVLKQLESRD